MNSARTSSGHLRLGQALAGRGELSVGLVLGPLRPPAASTSAAAWLQVVLAERVRPGQQLGQLGGRRRAAGQRGHHRQRLLPRPQVGPDRLAGDLRRAPDAEQVVGQLERPGRRARRSPARPMASAACAPRRGWRRCCRRRPSARPSCPRPSPGTRSRSRRRAARRPGRRPARRSAAAPRPTGSGRPTRRAAPVSSSSRSWARREQRVAGQDGRADAEHRPGRRPVPPLGVAVHDVVVQQREVVHELHRHRGGARPRSAGAPAARADSSASAGPQGLAAAAVARWAARRRRPSRGGRRRPGRTSGLEPRPRPSAIAGPTRSRAGGHAGRHDCGHGDAPCASLRGARVAPAGSSGRRAPARQARSRLSSTCGVQSAAHRALHRVRPSGIGPRAGQRQAGQRGRGLRPQPPAPGCLAERRPPLPGDEEVLTRASRGGREAAPASAGRNCSRSRAAGTST